MKEFDEEENNSKELFTVRSLRVVLVNPLSTQTEHFFTHHHIVSAKTLQQQRETILKVYRFSKCTRETLSTLMPYMLYRFYVLNSLGNLAERHVKYQIVFLK